ncbi:hypothetical protein [Halorussus halophilus]|uniref:hypothetical protein n=1 Tax=Halorussus halophilus TaxID=2650975 RepID=UPI0013017C00|nr:hypothetical protein [Halorussus halophilus]
MAETESETNPELLGELEDESFERLSRTLKSPYPDDEGTFWHDLLQTIASEVGELGEKNHETLDSKVIDDATGAQLDKLGELVQTTRHSGESDDHYRGRLKVQLRRFLSGATIEQIQETAAILLNVNSDRIAIEEEFDVEPGRFTVKFWQSDLEAAGVTDSEFRSFVDQVRSAGVRSVVQVRGTFIHRTVDDYENGSNDPGKGYYDPDDGVENGTYAGIL